VRCAALLVVSLASAAIGAQPCPPRIYRPPIVALEFHVDACDYLGILADAVDASAKCEVMLRHVSANANSRVHTLERSVADSLRVLFAEQFGFLDWKSPSPANGWILDVRLSQPVGRGTQSSLVVVLNKGGTRVATSEPLRFEEFDQIDVLSREAGAATRDRWIRETRALLEANQALNRKKLIDAVFRKIPLENLSVDPAPQSGALMASIRMRDRDIRVDPLQRPTFGWEIDSMVHQSDVARGSFKIGKCASRLADQTYNCKVMFLAFGQDTQPPASFVSFFRNSTLKPPRLLYILEYEPAKSECAFNGVLVQ
jgi:hypothetical protein